MPFKGCELIVEVSSINTKIVPAFDLFKEEKRIFPKQGTEHPNFTSVITTFWFPVEVKRSLTKKSILNLLSYSSRLTFEICRGGQRLSTKSHTISKLKFNFDQKLP